jgi:hypothetical protein
VDMEMIILTVGVGVMFLYSVYLHLTIRTVKSEIRELTGTLEDLGIKSKHLESWSHKIYRWIDKSGGKKGE